MVAGNYLAFLLFLFLSLFCSAKHTTGSIYLFFFFVGEAIMIIRQWTWTRNVDVEFEISAASESWCGWFGDRVAKLRILCGLSSDLAMSTLPSCQCSSRIWSS